MKAVSRNMLAAAALIWIRSCSSNDDELTENLGAIRAVKINGVSLLSAFSLKGMVMRA